MSIKEKKVTAKPAAEQQEPFAKIQALSEQYKIDLSLKYFTGFKPADFKVERNGRDVVIDCKKGKMDRPDMGIREVHIVYRLPEDCDVQTIKMKHDGFRVALEARRADYGRPLSLAVCDVTKKGDNVETIGHL